MVMMMMMNVSAMSECRTVVCRPYEACFIAEDDEPTCQCPTESVCDGLEDQQICAGNRQTYSNRCLLRVDECAANRSMPVLRRGPCRRRLRNRTRIPLYWRRPTGERWSVDRNPATFDRQPSAWHCSGNAALIAYLGADIVVDAARTQAEASTPASTMHLLLN